MNAPVASLIRSRGPRVSVVIPSYNRADLLPQAIDSVLAQTVLVSEIIVVDDGSTDATLAMLRRRCSELPQLRVIEQDHGGANRARNAGIAAARGEWIAFLDSDDAWENDKLEQQFALLRRMPHAAAAFTGSRLVGGSRDKVLIPRADPSLLELRCANVLGSTSSALVRTELLRRVGAFDPGLPSCQDWDLWFRLRQQGRFAVVRQPLTLFNCGDHARITTDLPRVLAGHRTMFGRLEEGVDRRSERRRIRATHRLVQAECLVRNGRPADALGLAVRSLAARPSRWGVRMLSEAVRDVVKARTSPR